MYQSYPQRMRLFLFLLQNKINVLLTVLCSCFRTRSMFLLTILCSYFRTRSMANQNLRYYINNLFQLVLFPALFDGRIHCLARYSFWNCIFTVIFSIIQSYYTGLPLKDETSETIVQNVQGYPQRMRLRGRLYRMYRVTSEG